MTILDIQSKKKHLPIAVITAYDYTFAKIIDGLVDVVLVGDSAGMVMYGAKNTLSITLDQMIYHTQAVSRGTEKSLVVADMPFMSYQPSVELALVNAGRLVSEANAAAVKLEGGKEIAETVRRLTQTGIPVMGHLGLTPQSVHQLGGFKVQGKTEASQKYILESALALEEAGAFSIVLESIPRTLAQTVTAQLKIPTIGIGAGPYCDGQVLVLQDLLGMNPDFKPRFVKQYTNLHSIIKDSIQKYAEDVRERKFPEDEHCF